ncbi:hypothetical protein Flavo103_29580 [Flavobacterium collinsii]|uniref:DUF7619 domain-containing protein n=1 Tax=Flavobacterium collinsii TaxID=1114861 RepID=UPI0022CBB45E|nr:T9SS type A sorting domain-containing protein [Flavobacterium collinsii]GIQ59822.1 hypothetical protein Flavo103_29580 [Flavobacterium collinsii]
MKKLYFLVFTFCFFNSLMAQVVTIPDINLKLKLIAANVDTNRNAEIEVSEALNINFLDLNNASINSLQGLEKFTNLETLLCNNNPIFTGVDFNVFKKLNFLSYSSIANVSYLNFENTNLSTLILEGLSNLNELQCNGNKNLVTLRLSGAQNLTTLWCNNNKLSALDITGLTKLKTVRCDGNQLQTLDASNLVNLTSLSSSGNLLTSLNVSGSTNLKAITCFSNKLQSLNASGLTNLTSLVCYSNELTQLNVNGLINLKELYCDGNRLPSLNVTGLTNLEYLNCTNNQLPELNVNGLTKLKGIKCGYNQLTALEVTGLTNLLNLECYHNQIKTLDLSDLKNIEGFSCYQNQLTSLFIRNGSNETQLLDFSQNPGLQYVCADESQLELVQQLITKYGYVNCNTNSYCSFKPAGTYYTVNGINRFDSNNNGCGALDPIVPGLKFELFDGTNTGTVISKTNGSFSIFLPVGTHTITPVLENPTYYTISPSNKSFTYPGESSPKLQDFCIVANGVHPDLEITILQITPARPGFEAKYKIVYKNKGNVTQSGTVNLSFNDAVLDLVTASPAVATQAPDKLTWNFSNLRPFQSAELNFTFKVNAPTAVPAVNNGDVLSFRATVSSVDTDETPIDNAFTLNQTVVGSYDPNDKTCLEGSVITPSLIGEYVHYIIRFENTGTYPAQNIVVKDMIDLSKFDISTLITTSASHSFVTNISAGNKVEFIFENINLPFDDASNDGYVAFKIKTKPTLAVGDTFTNDANIYFDYNFPILTNKATSTFKTVTLGTPDFEFSNYFTLYPNPANHTLNINSKEGIEIQSLSIYDMLGQLVIAVPNAKSVSTIDVSKLSSGNYFIKIKSDKGSSGMKFIKY